MGLEKKLANSFSKIKDNFLDAGKSAANKARYAGYAGLATTAVFLGACNGGDSVSVPQTSIQEQSDLGAENKIAVSLRIDGNSEIYIRNIDERGGVLRQERLTNNPARDTNPALSRDGERIAFMSDRDGGLPEIYVMNTDGSGLERLTNNPAFDGEPTWSPDSERIAFTSVRDGGLPEIYVMNTDGSGLERLTNSPAFNGEPAWSPDGKRIAFTSVRDGNFEIYVMNADGSGQERLTNSPANDRYTEDRYAHWSPDGKRIEFISSRNGIYEIYVMNADGSGQERSTNNRPSPGDPPIWSLFLSQQPTPRPPTPTPPGAPPPPPAQQQETFAYPLNPWRIPGNCEYGQLCAGSNEKPYHTGLDFWGDNDIVAAASGIVALIQRNDIGCAGPGTGDCEDHGLGHTVILEHKLNDGTTIYSQYSHLASIESSLEVGSCLTQGSQIGIMGSSGFGKPNYWGAQAHLHFEVKDRPIINAPNGSLNWGYSPSNPDDLGYHNPIDHLDKTLVQTICKD